MDNQTSYMIDKLSNQIENLKKQPLNQDNLQRLHLSYQEYYKYSKNTQFERKSLTDFIDFESKYGDISLAVNKAQELESKFLNKTSSHFLYFILANTYKIGGFSPHPLLSHKSLLNKALKYYEKAKNILLQTSTTSIKNSKDLIEICLNLAELRVFFKHHSLALKNYKLGLNEAELQYKNKPDYFLTVTHNIFHSYRKYLIDCNELSQSYDSLKRELNLYINFSNDGNPQFYKRLLEIFCSYEEDFFKKEDFAHALEIYNCSINLYCDTLSTLLISTSDLYEYVEKSLQKLKLYRCNLECDNLHESLKNIELLINCIDDTAIKDDFINKLKSI